MLPIQQNDYFADLTEDEQPFEIPTNWKFVNIMSLCNMKQWKTIPTNLLEKEGYPVYGANGIIGYYKEYNHDIETLLITCRGSTCGYTNITKGKCYVNGNALSCDDLSKSINILFFKYYTDSIDMKEQRIITGTAQPQITQENISKLYVPLPPLEEQERIIKVLNDLLPLCETL